MAAEATPEGTAMIVERARERFSVLDILLHTLGSHAPAGGFAALTDEHWQAELALNLLPAVCPDRASLPPMREAGRGAVMHVASIQRRLLLFDSTLGYAAAKAALTTYSTGPVKELAPRASASTWLSHRRHRAHRVDHATAWQMATESLGGFPLGRPRRAR